MNPIKKFQNDIRNLPEGKTERSYYPPFVFFLESQLPEVKAISEETAHGKIGFPDITVRHAAANKEIIGWIEVKTPDEDIPHKKFNEQFDKYKEGLENLIFTNFRKWELWQWKDGESHKVIEAACDISKYNQNDEQQLYKLLELFMARSVTEIATSEQLAIALARKAKLLSEQVAENLGKEDEKSPLTNLKKAFEKTLISNITARQFSNMVAETLTYSLFLAALESQAQGDKLTLTTAIDFLPKNVPVLRDLYDIVLKTSEKVSGIKRVAELIIDQLKTANLSAVLEEINKRKHGEDAIIHFYEPFLQAYSPDERKARGVYYTPKPVVDFIVRSVDSLLQKHFDKKDGLADEQVQILDPAAGTGTFLLSAIETVHQKTMDRYAKTNLHKEEFRNIVSRHILKNFYGFELMVAPYTIAHLKLALNLRRMGCDIATDSRLQIYLANTLDDPNAPPKDFFGFEALSEENEAANEIKKERPILAIIGNPPYSNFGKMNKQEWILDLLHDYKKNLNEKKINLDDDYIKFIRFAQWKIAKTGKGIFAMITANSFIDGITQRRMRESLLNTFDEIYIYNLHGNSRKGETAPGGGKDENIFNIKTGVSINIFVKKEHNSGDCKVFYADEWGRKKDKLKMLEKNFGDVDWQEIDYRRFNEAFIATEWGERLGALNFFVPSAEGEAAKMAEYGKFWGVQDIFPNYNSGIQTKRDNLTIQFEGDSFQTIMKDFAELDIEAIRAKYKLVADGDGWKIKWAQEDLSNNEKKIVDIHYRPFDIRKTVFTGKSGGFLARPRKKTMQHMLSKNLALISERLIPYQADIAVTCSKDIIDLHLVGGNSYAFPLYVYPENPLEKLTADCVPNLSSKFMETLAAKLGKTPSPENIFYYAYAIFHCPKYRQRYTEFLKIDFPRLPLTNDKKLFDELSRLGNDLVNLHLLGENPLDKSNAISKTIFNTQNKWNISIGGKDADADNWQINKITHDAINNRVYVDKGDKEKYFEGIDKATWEFTVGNYQPLDKWLKEHKKANRHLDKKHYMKIAVSLRETQKIMQEIDALIPNWKTFCK